MNKLQKFVLLGFISVALILLIFFFANQKNDQKLIAGENPNSDNPTPNASMMASPSPLLNITSDSNLSSEAAKLKVPEFSDDYQKLDAVLSNF